MNSTIVSMEKIQLNIKVTPVLKDKIQDIAHRENAPVSKIILSALANKYPELLDDILKH